MLTYFRRVDAADHRKQVDRTAEILTETLAAMDKKPVNLLSTFNDAKEEKVVQRRTGKELIEVKCPTVLPTYLRTMRAVDVFSQRLSYSKIGRRSKKWFYSLMWFMMDTGIHNAFILYQKKHKREHYTEKDFRKELMTQLVNGFTSRKLSRRAAPPVKHCRDSTHLLEHTACKMAKIRSFGR